MKKLIFVFAAIVALIILFSTIGPMIGLAICLGILYFSFKKFVRASETTSKVFWGIIGVVALIGAISNLPAIIGLVAAYVLYYVYKNWNKKSDVIIEKPSDDPFTNFEKEWEKLNKTW
ncbi:flagellar basal body rod protein [Caldibacillus lycopersici]|uniref:Flagellar basal body rod protein n=1 Tax=Perspicuibacillus lycopersici TaxID=1325689 RepID=A0AAE3IX26_9BACI|nr:flagellar basal body rod protein [Perspicuibacillus lycopersici]MCU9614489.1 flagellar basal body rod protein [Perspicuibacillus lycopersici]